MAAGRRAEASDGQAMAERRAVRALLRKLQAGVEDY
jgi:hypothetical protein